jgi:hypothetical protein
MKMKYITRGKNHEGNEYFLSLRDTRFAKARERAVS